MKLPPFEDFFKALTEGRYKFDDIKERCSLKPNPTPDEVVNFAERLSHQKVVSILRCYHSWLAEQLTTPEQKL